MKLKVLVCGGRKFNSLSVLHGALMGLNRRDNITHVIHGGATGADALAREWARINGIQEVCCPADWHMHGRAAGPIRNSRMLDLSPDVVVALPGGAGTADTVAKAKALGIKVLEVECQ